MKDKLVKTKHRAAHYYFKRVGFCFSLFLGATIVVAIPLSIATIVRNNNVESKDSEYDTKNNETTSKQELLRF